MTKQTLAAIAATLLFATGAFAQNAADVSADFSSWAKTMENQSRAAEARALSAERDTQSAESRADKADERLANAKTEQADLRKRLSAAEKAQKVSEKQAMKAEKRLALLDTSNIGPREPLAQKDCAQETQMRDMPVPSESAAVNDTLAPHMMLESADAPDVLAEVAVGGTAEATAVPVNDVVLEEKPAK